MATSNKTNIMKLMNLHKPGTPYVASWLKRQGISYDLQKYYRRAGWLESFGRGAYKRRVTIWHGQEVYMPYKNKLDYRYILVG